MTVKKIIQEELGGMLEEQGFKFTKAEPCFWPYEREKDGVHQEIMVARDRYEKGYIKVIFATNAYGQQPKEFRDFVPEEGAKKWDYWGYGNEEELREVLREFRRLILEYGLDFIEEISQTAHCGRRKPHVDFGTSAFPTAQSRGWPQTFSGAAARCRSLV